jgi:2-polyprenyl-6-methoxyphenol hydroxylase-like FAD-dependent oxidoreductase
MASSESRLRRAVIIGGSIGGLVAGLFLRKAGWQVDIFERVPDEIKSRGAGIVTHGPLFAALGVLGINPGESIGVSVSGRRTFGLDGGIEGHLDFPQALTSWDRLYQLLYEAFPLEHYHQGKGLTHLDQRPNSVLATFSDGSAVEADLLIGADGHRSTVRSFVAPEIQPRYAGYVAWRGLVEESTLSPETRNDLFNFFSFSLPDHEQILGYPVAGTNEDMRPGHLRYNFVWYRPADENTELRRLLTDSNGACNGVSIAPTMIRPEILKEMRSDARELLSPQFAEVVERTRMPLIQPIYDVLSERIVFGKVVLLGDAGFVARPHCGMGVTKAAQDAHALYDALQRSPDLGSALIAYEADRLPVGQKVVGHAHALGAYMQAQIASEEERVAAETYRSIAAVMKETASAAFLAAH